MHLNDSDGKLCGRLCDSKTLTNIESHLSYLPDEQLSDVIFLLQPYPLLFSDVASWTILLFRDIDVVSAAPY